MGMMPSEGSDKDRRVGLVDKLFGGSERGVGEVLGGGWEGRLGGGQLFSG